MNRNLFWLLTVLLFASTHLVEAQQINRIPRIGILSPLSPGPSNEIHVFRQGLRDSVILKGKTSSSTGDSPTGKSNRVSAFILSAIDLSPRSVQSQAKFGLFPR